MTDPTDPTMEALSAAIAQVHTGDAAGARAAFAALWPAVERTGDPLHVVTLCHFMADVQDDPAEELVWDLRALAAADGLTDERARAYHGSLAVRSFYPSLHLNVGEGYRKAGAPELARRHLASARAALDDLPAEGYGVTIRGALDRLAARLEAGA